MVCSDGHPQELTPHICTGQRTWALCGTDLRGRVEGQLSTERKGTRRLGEGNEVISRKPQSGMVSKDEEDEKDPCL